jgi:uncharacterized delta-60 repeat protein
MLDFALLRYNTDGSPDSHFGSDGIVTTEIPDFYYFNVIAIQNDSKILVAGNIHGDLSLLNDGDFVLVRYNNDGSIDNSFGSYGKTILDLFGRSGEVLSAMKLHNNRIYITGTILTEGGKDFVVVALQNDAGPLPLNLLDFEGEAKDAGAVLKWRTENEINTSHFEIEYSSNGQSFSKVGSVTARPNTTHIQLYDFIYPLAQNGIYYFRLKMVDIDGHFTYSKVVRISNKHPESYQFTLSPNPAHSFFKITGGNLSSVMIKDAWGRTVKTFIAADSNNEFSIKNLPSAVYFVILIDKKGNKETRKLMIK